MKDIPNYKQYCGEVVWRMGRNGKAVRKRIRGPLHVGNKIVAHTIYYLTIAMVTRVWKRRAIAVSGHYELDLRLAADDRRCWTCPSMIARYDCE